jgi:hypothetical protein
MSDDENRILILELFAQDVGVGLDAIRFYHLTTRIPEHRGRPDIDLAHRVVPHDDQECGRCNQIDRFHRFNPRTQTIAVTDTTTSVGVSF